MTRSLFLGLVLLAACRVPGGMEDTAVSIEAPEHWSAGAGGEEAPAPDWWTAFACEELNELVAEALEHNHDLAASAARVETAVAQARLAGADLVPSLGVGGTASRSQQVFVGFPIPGGANVLTSRTTSYGVSLDVSWEVDLWGRLHAARRAAVEDLQASAEDLRAAQLSLSAQTVKSWLAWQQALLQEALAEETATSYARTSEIVRSRYDNGRASMLDVHRAQSDLASARARLESRRATTERAGRQLEILLGRHPGGALARTPRLPEVPPLPAAGVPSDLLRRRPDLVAAARRLRAADERVYEARARLYPSINLSASGSRNSDRMGDLTDSDFDGWSLLAGLAQPIFQGGRLRAGVELADARAREAAATYASSVLNAFFEVETTLAVEGWLERREREQERSATAAVTARALAQERYAAGRDDLNTLLDAERAALLGESELLDVRFQRLEARVDLTLALGGGLPARPDLPEEPE